MTKKSAGIVITDISTDDCTGFFVVQMANDRDLGKFRKIIHQDIPIRAIDQVSIFNNTTSMVDENLAARLSLIPVRQDLEQDLCLYVKHPANSARIKLITTDDLYYTTGESLVFEPPIAIMNLLPGQSVSLHIHTSVSIGAEHSKWSPSIVFTYEPINEGLLQNKYKCSIETTDKINIKDLLTNAIRIYRQKY